MWQERNRIEHPLIFVGLEMKCLLRDGCSGRSACRAPLLAPEISTCGANSRLPAFLLPYSVPLQQPHRVLAFGVQAVLLLASDPRPQGHAAKEASRGYRGTAASPARCSPSRKCPHPSEHSPRQATAGFSR